MLQIGLNPAFLFAHYAERVYCDEIIAGAKKAKELGFPSLGLEIYDDAQYAAYNAKNIGLIRRTFGDLGLKSTAFLACAPRAKLASLTPEIRREGLADFARMVEIVAELGLTDTISIVSSAPPEAISSFMETYPGAPPASLRLPAGFTWADIWNTYIDTMGRCLELAGASGLRLAIEPLPMSVVSTIDSYLRLAAELRSKSFGVLIDTSHLFYQRECLPVVIEKVKDSLFGFCASDNDGIEDYHWAPGKGRIDWREVLRSLKKIGYEGSIDLEINVADDPDAEYTQARSYLESILLELD